VNAELRRAVRWDLAAVLAAVPAVALGQSVDATGDLVLRAVSVVLYVVAAICLLRALAIGYRATQEEAQDD
jgi:hypothetical protein